MEDKGNSQGVLVTQQINSNDKPRMSFDRVPWLFLSLPISHNYPPNTTLFFFGYYIDDIILAAVHAVSAASLFCVFLGIHVRTMSKSAKLKYDKDSILTQPR